MQIVIKYLSNERKINLVEKQSKWIKKVEERKQRLWKFKWCENQELQLLEIGKEEAKEESVGSWTVEIRKKRLTSWVEGGILSLKCRKSCLLFPVFRIQVLLLLSLLFQKFISLIKPLLRL